MTKTKWHFSQKTIIKTKLTLAVKINTTNLCKNWWLSGNKEALTKKLFLEVTFSAAPGSSDDC